MQHFSLSFIVTLLVGSSQLASGFIWGAGQRLVGVGVRPRSLALQAQAIFREDNKASTDLSTRLLADLKVAAQSGDHGKAMEILGQVTKEQLPASTVHFNRALKALVTGKQINKLDEVLKTMADSGCSWDDTTVKLLVNTHASEGKMEAAIDVFERARDEELIGAVDPKLYDTIIKAYRKTGAFEKAMDICDEMRALRLNPTKEGYAFIATVAIKDGKTYLIARTLDTMKQEGFSEEDVAYVKDVILSELPDNLKHQAEGELIAKKESS